MGPKQSGEFREFNLNYLNGADSFQAFSILSLFNILKVKKTQVLEKQPRTFKRLFLSILPLTFLACSLDFHSLSNQLKFSCFIISSLSSHWLDSSYDASTSSSLLAWWLLEKQRSLQQAAEVFILLSTDTLRLITALRGSWRNVTVGSLEMTTLQQLLVLWCSSKES